jgi:hypothetical protein
VSCAPTRTTLLTNCRPSGDDHKRTSRNSMVGGKRRCFRATPARRNPDQGCSMDRVRREAEVTIVRPRIGNFVKVCDLAVGKLRVFGSSELSTTWHWRRWQGGRFRFPIPPINILSKGGQKCQTSASVPPPARRLGKTAGRRGRRQCHARSPATPRHVLVCGPRTGTPKPTCLPRRRQDRSTYSGMACGWGAVDVCRVPFTYGKN